MSTGAASGIRPGTALAIRTPRATVFVLEGIERADGAVRGYREHAAGVDPLWLAPETIDALRELPAAATRSVPIGRTAAWADPVVVG